MLGLVGLLWLYLNLTTVASGVNMNVVSYDNEVTSGTIVSALFFSLTSGSSFQQQPCPTPTVCTCPKHDPKDDGYDHDVKKPEPECEPCPEVPQCKACPVCDDSVSTTSTEGTPSGQHVSFSRLLWDNKTVVTGPLPWREYCRFVEVNYTSISLVHHSYQC